MESDAYEGTPPVCVRPAHRYAPAAVSDFPLQIICLQLEATSQPGSPVNQEEGEGEEEDTSAD